MDSVFEWMWIISVTGFYYCSRKSFPLHLYPPKLRRTTCILAMLPCEGVVAEELTICSRCVFSSQVNAYMGCSQFSVYKLSWLICGFCIWNRASKAVQSCNKESNAPLCILASHFTLGLLFFLANTEPARKSFTYWKAWGNSKCFLSHSLSLLFTGLQWKNTVMLVYIDCFSRHFIWISFRVNHSNKRQRIYCDFFLFCLSPYIHMCVYACVRVCLCAGKLYRYCYLLELHWLSEHSQICFHFRCDTGCSNMLSS